MTQTVICIKWGTLYGPEYVNRLYGMASRNTERPLRFICFTDDKEGIHEDVEVAPLPEIDLPEKRMKQPWRKVSLWQENLYGLEGDVLFLDLDLLVCNSIDDFFDYKPEEEFIVIHNWTTRDKAEDKYSRVGNTSCYRFRVGANAYLYEKLQADFESYYQKYRNSQTFISNEIKSICYWPDDWCISFKHSMIPAWPMRYFQAIEKPKVAKIVAFTGKPDIHDVIAGTWPEDKFFKRIYKVYRKPDWVEAIWTD